jgi:FMN phosphatase YigB (HAD superfamily)
LCGAQDVRASRQSSATLPQTTRRNAVVVKLILWDFGDTLADERWMLAPMVGVPDWPNIYREQVVDGALGVHWNTGALSTRDVAAEVADELGIESDAVIAHMHGCSRRVRFFPKVMSFVKEFTAPQSIVTVNPDIFTDIVVPEYQLDGQVDLIVTSWQQGTEDKSALCELAIAQLGIAPLAECLLVDNRLDNVLAWCSKGGAAYHFKGESAFCEEFAITDKT